MKQLVTDIKVDDYENDNHFSNNDNLANLDRL